MASEASDRTCPDCDGSMHGIRLLDKIGRSSSLADLEYALPEAKRSIWGSFPVAGTVVACMCDRCGRILLYGRPSADPQPGPGD